MPVRQVRLSTAGVTVGPKLLHFPWLQKSMCVLVCVCVCVCERGEWGGGG